MCPGAGIDSSTASLHKHPGAFGAGRFTPPGGSLPVLIYAHRREGRQPGGRSGTSWPDRSRTGAGLGPTDFAQLRRLLVELNGTRLLRETITSQPGGDGRPRPTVRDLRTQPPTPITVVLGCASGASVVSAVAGMRSGGSLADVRGAQPHGGPGA
jgi:hypothetical protein